MQKNKINLIKDVHNYVLRIKTISLRKKVFFLALFIFISLITLVAAFSISVLSILKLGKLWIFHPGNVESNNTWQNKLIDNYIYITSTINACVTLLGSISSFFAFKDGYLKYRIIYRRVDFELIQYENQMGYYYSKNEKEMNSLLIDRIFLILNASVEINKIIKQEVGK